MPNFFNDNSNEWDIYNNATNEFIEFYGVPCKYLKRTNVNIDYLFGEDNALSEYKDFFDIKLYPEDMLSFGGSFDNFTKFGLHLDDQITFFVQQQQIVEKLNGVMPVQGDLILFLPGLEDVFEVTHVEDKGVFYPFGKNTTYKIFCRKFFYGHEVMDTGLSQMDAYNTISDTSITADIMVSGSTVYEYATTITSTYTQAEGYLDFSEDDPFKDGF